MQKQEILAVVLVLVFSVGTILAVVGYEIFRKQPSTVELLARAPEKGNWNPRVIRVQSGKKIDLVIRNVDVVTHGFYLPEFNLIVQEIKAGEVKKISFTPDRQGEFTFYCSVWCSDYHMSMRGKLIVE
jgi:cytochrome c oxidase subunit 2